MATQEVNPAQRHRCTALSSPALDLSTWASAPPRNTRALDSALKKAISPQNGTTKQHRLAAHPLAGQAAAARAGHILARAHAG